MSFKNISSTVTKPTNLVAAGTVDFSFPPSSSSPFPASSSSSSPSPSLLDPHVDALLTAVQSWCFLSRSGGVGVGGGGGAPTPMTIANINSKWGPPTVGANGGGGGGGVVSQHLSSSSMGLMGSNVALLKAVTAFNSVSRGALVYHGAYYAAPLTASQWQHVCRLVTAPTTAACGGRDKTQLISSTAENNTLTTTAGAKPFSAPSPPSPSSSSQPTTPRSSLAIPRSPRKHVDGNSADPITGAIARNSFSQQPPPPSPRSKLAANLLLGSGTAAAAVAGGREHATEAPSVTTNTTAAPNGDTNSARSSQLNGASIPLPPPLHNTNNGTNNAAARGPSTSPPLTPLPSVLSAPIPWPRLQPFVKCVEECCGGGGISMAMATVGGGEVATNNTLTLVEAMARALQHLLLLPVAKSTATSAPLAPLPTGKAQPLLQPQKGGATAASAASSSSQASPPPRPLIDYVLLSLPHSSSSSSSSLSLASLQSVPPSLSDALYGAFRTMANSATRRYFDGKNMGALEKVGDGGEGFVGVVTDVIFSFKSLSSLWAVCLAAPFHYSSSSSHHHHQNNAAHQRLLEAFGMVTMGALDAIVPLMGGLLGLAAGEGLREVEVEAFVAGDANEASFSSSPSPSPSPSSPSFSPSSSSSSSPFLLIASPNVAHYHPCLLPSQALAMPWSWAGALMAAVGAVQLLCTDTNSTRRAVREARIKVPPMMRCAATKEGSDTHENAKNGKVNTAEVSSSPSLGDLMLRFANRRENEEGEEEAPSFTALSVIAGTIKALLALRPADHRTVAANAAKSDDAVAPPSPSRIVCSGPLLLRLLTCLQVLTRDLDTCRWLCCGEVGKGGGGRGGGQGGNEGKGTADAVPTTQTFFHVLMELIERARLDVSEEERKNTFSSLSSSSASASNCSHCYPHPHVALLIVTSAAGILQNMARDPEALKVLRRGNVIELLVTQLMTMPAAAAATTKGRGEEGEWSREEGRDVRLHAHPHDGGEDEDGDGDDPICELQVAAIKVILNLHEGSEESRSELKTLLTNVIAEYHLRDVFCPEKE